MPARLTIGDLAAIAPAPPEATPVEFARQLGKPADLIGRQLRRMRRVGGWYSELRLPPCTVCGETVVGPPRRITHVGCVQARWARDKPARRKADSRPDVPAEQRAREWAAALRTYHALSPERRAAWYARTEAARRRDYAITRAATDAHWQRWTDDAERYLQDTPDRSGAHAAADRVGGDP